MRSRILPAVGISAIALVAAAAFAPGATASGHHAGTSAKSTGTHSTAKTAATCASQRDNDNGVGIVSQNFEATFDQYDAAGADSVKLTGACALKTTSVDGVYFNGSGPADSVNVTFYKGKSKPGAATKTSANASYTDAGFGSFVVDTAGKLSKKKTKWVSVQANLAFSAGGEWGWNTNNTIRGKAAVWQNPGNGFATGCTTWTTMTTCIPSGEGGDNSYSLEK